MVSYSLHDRTVHPGAYAKFSPLQKRGEGRSMADDGLCSSGELLRTFRTRPSLTQQQRASAIGLHRNVIRRWERGDFLPRSRSPRTRPPPQARRPEDASVARSQSHRVFPVLVAALAAQSLFHRAKGDVAGVTRAVERCSDGGIDPIFSVVWVRWCWQNPDRAGVCLMIHSGISCSLLDHGGNGRNGGLQRWTEC